MENNYPGIAFLGMCERVANVREVYEGVFKWNIIGLKSIIFSYFFPQNLSGLTLGFVINTKCVEEEIKLTFRNKQEEVLGFINIFAKINEPSPPEELEGPNNNIPFLTVPAHGWFPYFVKLDGTKLVIPHPGVYFIHLEHENGSTVIGQLYFDVVNPQPLTPERIAAIKSDPGAAKAIKAHMGCNHCPSLIKMYSALEPNEDIENEGYILSDRIPDEFVCDCGKTKIDLHSIRDNLHGNLGKRLNRGDNLSLMPLYEKSSLEDIRNDFARLLNEKTKEELLQQFIQNNPILLHQFPADKIYPKPPILNLYVADFGILTPQKELLLIEIEKTTTRLLKKDGDNAKDLNHAFDQVRNWLHTVDEHRLAVLDSIGIERNQVAMISGVVIAGRDSNYDAKHLRRLKGTDWGRISFLTYDDLLSALDGLISNMESL